MEKIKERPITPAESDLCDELYRKIDQVFSEYDLGIISVVLPAITAKALCHCSAEGDTALIDQILHFNRELRSDIITYRETTGVCKDDTSASIPLN